MLGISWFNTRAAKQFGISLASDLARRFPPSSLARTDKAADRQLRDIVEGIATLAMQYCIDQRTGLLGKAALANGFRWKLLELGYHKEFVEELSAELAKRMAPT